MGEIVSVRDDTTNRNIVKNYPRKSKEFGSKLSSIREEMREFCNSMDKFVDENKIVFKNGEVEGFWSQKTTDANSQTDSVDERETRETEAKGSASEEDKLRWWSTEERKLKVREMIKARDDEAKEDQARAENVRTNEDLDRRPSDDEKRRSNNFQDVYDLMTLKTCPNVFPESTEPTYTVKDADNLECERTGRKQEKSCRMFDSLFAELRNCNSVRRKTNVSDELMTPEEVPDSQTSEIDTKKKCVSNFIDTITNIDLDERLANRKSIAEGDTDSDARTDILEDKFHSFSLESPKEKKNNDESDDDSFKTARSLPEDTQMESVQESPEILRLSTTEINNDQIVDGIKNQSIDNPVDGRRKEIALDKERGVICEDKTNDKAKRSPDRSSERRLSAETAELPTSQVKLLVQTMNRLSLDRTSQPSRLTGKRIREAEDIQVGTKKSLLIEEMDPGRKSEERKTRSHISERCRQHAIQEARKFVRKASPLIDKCITTLIKDTENIDKESRYCSKYDRRNLAECLTSVFSAKSNLDKVAGDSAERHNRHDKYGIESDDITNAYPARRESIEKRTINSKSTAPADDTGKI